MFYELIQELINDKTVVNISTADGRIIAGIIIENTNGALVIDMDYCLGLDMYKNWKALIINNQICSISYNNQEGNSK